MERRRVPRGVQGDGAERRAPLVLAAMATGGAHF